MGKIFRKYFIDWLANGEVFTGENDMKTYIKNNINELINNYIRETHLFDLDEIKKEIYKLILKNFNNISIDDLSIFRNVESDNTCSLVINIFCTFIINNVSLPIEYRGIHNETF